MRIYISADIEGVAGFTHPEQGSPGNGEYERARIWMTDEVSAACRGALAAGAEEIVVCDGHNTFRNLLPDRLPSEVTLILGKPRMYGMMHGIDDGYFDAAFFLGYHTGLDSLRGIAPHTMTGALIDIRFNGQVQSETTMNAAIAGAFDVPIALITGDDALVEHGQSTLGPIESVVTKWAYGRRSARSLTPSESQARIEAAAQRALTDLPGRPPCRVDGAVTLELSFRDPLRAELLEYLEDVERVDAHSIRTQCSDVLATIRFVRFVLSHAHVF